MSNQKFKPNQLPSCKVWISPDHSEVMGKPIYNEANRIFEGECEVIEDVKMLEVKDE